MSKKEQDTYFSRVSWCILGLRGIWERLPKEAHYQLETNNNVGGEILDAQAQKWIVNLTKMEATAIASSAVAKIKRLENLPGARTLSLFEFTNKTKNINPQLVNCTHIGLFLCLRFRFSTLLGLYEHRGGSKSGSSAIQLC